MNRGTALILSAVFTWTAHAKTKVDVPVFENKAAGGCSVTGPWQKDLPVAFQQQLITGLNESGLFNIVESELLRGESRDPVYGSTVATVHKKSTYKVSQYSITGSVRTFDYCNGKAEVALEITVKDASGAVAQNFVSKALAPSRTAGMDPGIRGASLNSGVFKDSPIGKAASAAIGDATEKLKKAFPDREVAVNGYKVRTIRKSRGR